MFWNNIEWICPIVVTLIILTLKIFIANEPSWENFKRILVESSVDLMALSISFTVSFMIAPVNENLKENFYHGLVVLLIFIFVIILTIAFSQISIKCYSRSENIWHIIWGFAVGYILSIPCLYYSINLIQSLGGA